MVFDNLTDDLRQLRREASPLGLEGTAWDVAWAAVFLASDEARWITGIVLPVDAGLMAATPMAMLNRRYEQ
jgi:NAD(P)-dependent dehydrogenase (short-subunit alcohol dehydrogenase family)